MITKNRVKYLHVFSPMQISEAFKKFGISDGDDSVLVVLVQDQDDPPPLSDITSRVDGRQVPVDDVSSMSDTAKIKKVHHLVVGGN